MYIGWVWWFILSSQQFEERAGGRGQTWILDQSVLHCEVLYKKEICVFKNLFIWAEKGAQPVNLVLCKCENLCPTPALHEKPYMMVHACNPSAGVAEIDRSLGVSGQPSCSIQSVLGSIRRSLQKQGGKLMKNNTWESPVAYTHKYTHAHTPKYMCVPSNINTLKKIAELKKNWYTRQEPSKFLCEIKRQRTPVKRQAWS